MDATPSILIAMAHPFLELLTEGRGRRQTPREPWRRNLLVLWFAQFIAMVGMSACIPFLPLFIHELGVADKDANLWSGLITAAPFIMSSMLTPVWGAMGDKYGQKSMVVRAIFGLGITMTLMGFSTNVWMLFVLRIIQGAASGFVASNNSFVSAQSPPERVGYSLATLQTSIAAGNIIGPLVGGTISDAFGMRTVFWFVGVMCAVSLFIVVRRVHEDRTVRAPRPGRVLGNIGLAVRNPSLRTLLVIMLISQTAIVLPSPIFPYYIAELGAPRAILSTLAGAIVSMVGLCSIVSAQWWGVRSDTMGFRSTMMIAGSIVGAGMFAQAFVPSYQWLFPVRIVIGLAVGAILPLLYGELTRRSPQGRRGGIMGLASSATLMGNLIGPLVCSAITMALPLKWTFVVSAIVMASSLMLVRGLPESRVEEEGSS